MQQRDIHSLLQRFFTANGCSITESTEGHLAVQLTVEMDKELMNRPFYWHYLEKTGGIPNPLPLTLITEKEKTNPDLKGEFIHFGAPRLHQIFQSAKVLGGFIRLYEKSDSQSGSMPLHPWLGVNIQVSYQCDMKKDLLYSIGLNLISGAMAEDFQHKIELLQMTPKIPDLCFTMSPLVKPQSGLNRIYSFIQDKIQQEEHTWADDARQRWNADLMLLNHFYENLEEKPEAYWLEKEALRELYEPKITISVQNGGIFYLNPFSIGTI
ncbi:YqhG family protein [Metabacillus sp. GX 13764]|uniref:YqhG family protein n=1 Tax=Metabacillus kandeliae TaxID=2900151 RepID=UPI001E5991EF|nr:YqhG family protein [Metabacillus kandeliae]MCD7033176.1 YqhG family protein [Metabacillus kandeliae]